MQVDLHGHEETHLLLVDGVRGVYGSDRLAWKICVPKVTGKLLFLVEGHEHSVVDELFPGLKLLVTVLLRSEDFDANCYWNGHHDGQLGSRRPQWCFQSRDALD